MKAKEFLKSLRQEIEAHPAVNHPLLARVQQVPFTREDFKVMGLQHYPLVGNFTNYMEFLLIRSPDSDAKQWLAKVLVDEYGEGSENKDHATVYLEYLAAAGAEPGEELRTPLHPDVVGFITEHRRICTQEPYLVGLGALGPGHEWSIPKMFPPICKGLRRAGFSTEEMLYFDLHMEQDIDHGLWLEEALEMFAEGDRAQQEIRRGALLSLAARQRFWSGVQAKIVGWRQPNNLHLRKQIMLKDGQEQREWTFGEFKKEPPVINFAA
ncbi:MAG: iron-containing redox enzyme family protein [Myxococcota bacterium]|nr:iron-containing redox enzyme family protein [Myxococcota bacterium]